MESWEYQVGDTVQLNSGSCDWKVVHMQPALDQMGFRPEHPRTDVVVEWYVDGQRYMDILPQVCCRKV